MKIGIDVTMLQVRQGRHGTGSYLRGLLGGLARGPAHDYALFAWREPDLELPALPANFRVVPLPAPPFGRGRALATHQVALPRLARRLGLGVLHVPGVAVTASMPGAPLWSPVPLVVTAHDLIPLLFPTSVLPKRRHRVFYRLMLDAAARAAHVLCDAEATRRDLIERLDLDAHRVSVAPLAAAPSFVAAPIAAENGRAHALPSRYVLHVGGPAPIKNLRALLAAMAALWDAGRTDADLVAVTTLPFDPVALCPAVLRHRARVHVLEQVSERFLVWIYQHARALVVPSLYEGFGLPVLEAMGAGCPVIASRAGSLPEVGGDAAVYADPRRVDDLAGAIARLVADDAARARRREAGFAHARTFTWDRTAAGTLAAYRAAVRR